MGWTGERWRGGYGIWAAGLRSDSPFEGTLSLGLIFGAWNSDADGPRLEIDVGRSFVSSVDSPSFAFVRGRRLGFTRDEQREAADAGGRDLPVHGLSVRVEGTDHTFRMMRNARWWIAQGRWDGYCVEIHATDVDPTALALQRASSIPPRYSGGVEPAMWPGPECDYQRFRDA